MVWDMNVVEAATTLNLIYLIEIYKDNVFASIFMSPILPHNHSAVVKS
jgi:hypothetical protein